MKKILLLLLAVQYAHAEKIIFSNNNQEAEIVGSASINVATGDITVQTATDKYIVDDIPTIESGFVALYAVDSYEANSIDEIDLAWALGYGHSCTGTVVSGNVTGWSGQVPSSTQPSQIGFNVKTVTINSPTADVRINCMSDQGGTISDTITIAQETIQSTGDAPTLTLSANQTSVPDNTTPITLTWTVGNDATSCTATGGWTGSKNNNDGVHQQQNITIGSNTTFSLTCSNQWGSSPTRSVTVNFQPPTNPECDNITPPTGTTEHLDQNGDPISYVDITGGAEFGYSQSATNNYVLPRNKYSAFAFTAPSEALRRKETFEEPLANTTPAIYTVAISKCPGDFSGQTVQGVCKRTNLITSLNWSTFGNANTGIECKLEQGENYYLNVIHSQNSPYSATSCSNGSGCGVLFTEVPN